MLKSFQSLKFRKISRHNNIFQDCVSTKRSRQVPRSDDPRHCFSIVVNDSGFMAFWTRAPGRLKAIEVFSIITPAPGAECEGNAFEYVCLSVCLHN